MPGGLTLTVGVILGSNKVIDVRWVPGPFPFPGGEPRDPMECSLFGSKHIVSVGGHTHNLFFFLCSCLYLPCAVCPKPKPVPIYIKSHHPKKIGIGMRLANHSHGFC